MVSTRASIRTKVMAVSDTADGFAKEPAPKKAKKAVKKSTAAKKSTTKQAKSVQKSPTKTKSSTVKDKLAFPPAEAATSKDKPLLSLDDLLPVTLVNRPSKRNRSPYVADVLISTSTTEEEPREAICHVPNLDMGGKCAPGVSLLVKPARDKKGQLVGSQAVSPKYGTPKCEFIAQLLQVDETAIGYTPVTWVGAHPSLGEKLAEQLLLRNALSPQLPQIKSLQREVRNVAGADMRADFVLQFEDPAIKPCVLEVKTVVDTDYAPDRTPTQGTKCVFVSPHQPYRRGAIFPWGQGNQKGPNGEKVVSARAIKHVRELTRIAKGDLVGDDKVEYQAAVLFIVIRKDAEYFRPNHEACPSFCNYLRQAQEAGVTVLAKRMDWGDTPETLGQCQEGPLLDIEWPDLASRHG